jgi:(E)-4-hydroxy-3-methylbut-2-enyl-diphosphate synthase
MWERNFFSSRRAARPRIPARNPVETSCPSCGRAQVDVYTLADQVTAGLEGMAVPLRVAVMGCVVNGPGEAREADLGVASGNGKGQIFVKGKVIKTVPEHQIVATLIEEAMRIAEELGETGELTVTTGEPTVTVG